MRSILTLFVLVASLATTSAWMRFFGGGRPGGGGVGRNPSRYEEVNPGVYANSLTNKVHPVRSTRATTYASQQNRTKGYCDMIEQISAT
ncbi:hypothetical protein CTAYLR_006132 [Chrysophaeum taylorii]|uniref:Secreted protein n=1 Tax=Chrysophaeum taylorii TaxID=2483200 RepID=A0AAD7UPZ8_9STRA|nr:hypothetical protein CTAYLR_006132 [Chrysophaeum taylorii]